MTEKYFVDFELEDDMTVDESALWGYRSYENKELIVSDIMTDEGISLINNSEESPVLESILTTDAGEVKIAFVEKLVIKDDY